MAINIGDKIRELLRNKFTFIDIILIVTYYLIALASAIVLKHQTSILLFHDTH